MPRIEKKHLIITCILFVQTAFGIFGGVVAASTSGSERLFPGVFINGIDVGDMTPAEAEGKLRQRMEQLIDTVLPVQYQNKKWHLSYGDLGVKVNYRQTVWAAYLLGRETNPLSRVVSSFKMRRQQTEMNLDMTYNENKINNFLAAVAKDMNRSAIDAKAVMKNGRIVVTPEQIGIEIDAAATRKLFIEAVKQLSQGPVNLVVRQTKPQVNARDLAAIKDELATFKTVFNSSQVNRAHNIRLAAQFLNNTIVKPGEVFSFNKQVGPRMEKFGYKEAPVITNNKLQPGIGGGVCQVSTTLYQTVLYAGMSAKERTPHSIPPTYVPLGQDAAVADGQIDFTFQNTGRYPVLIVATVSGNKLTVRLFGKKEHNRLVQLSSENIRRIEPVEVIINDPSMPKGSKTVIRGERGYRVKVYRTIKENGKLVKKELLSDDYYRPTDTEVRVGTR